MTALIWKGLLAIVVGLGLFGLGGSLGYESWELVFAGVGTQGMVVGHRVTLGSKGGRRFHPVVEFTTVAGKRVRADSTLGTSSPDTYPVGSRVDLYYRPDAPRTIKLDDFEDLWASPAVLTVFGLVLMLVGGAQIRREVAAIRRRQLKHTGLRATGRLTSCHPVSLTNRKSSVVVEASVRHPTTGQELHLVSDYLRIPSPREVPQGNVDIYFDTQDPAKYYIDVDFLTRQAG